MSETMEFDRAGRLQLQLNAARDEIELLRAELDTHTQDTALIERLQQSINNCSTEEGLCYAVELQRKDAEIARLQAQLDEISGGRLDRNAGQ